MTDRGVLLIGIGAQTAVGRTASISAASQRAGICRLGEHPFMIDHKGEPMIVAMASYLPEDMFVIERMAELALPAARQALIPLQDAGERLPVMIIIGLPTSRPGLPSYLAQSVRDYFNSMIQETIVIADIEIVEAGHAAGLIAMERAWKVIQQGSTKVCLIGGVDSYLEPETLEWLEEYDQLHSESNPWGFPPGEAAGFCLLASSRVTQEHQLKPLARIAAVSNAVEHNRIKTESVCLGEGLTKAWQGVFRLAGVSNGQIAESICDMNGEPYRADELGFAMTRMSSYFADPNRFMAPAECWGDVGAASGPLFACLAACAGERGYAEGNHYLVWASSENGERSAAVLDLLLEDKQPKGVQAWV